jgi:hypothetical protein
MSAIAKNVNSFLTCRSALISDNAKASTPAVSAPEHLEISLLDSAYQRSTANGDVVLMSAAKRYPFS